jgi:hypothetical protein
MAGDVRPDRVVLAEALDQLVARGEVTRANGKLQLRVDT